MGRTIEIWQLKKEYAEFLFMPTSYWERIGEDIHASIYEKVYAFTEAEGETMGPEDVYRVFNLERPKDFTGHSLSVSDIVVFRNGSEATAWFCERVCFTDITKSFESPL